MSITYILDINEDGSQRTRYPGGDWQAPIVLPKPTNLRSQNVTDTELTIKWDYPSSGTDASGFWIQVWIDGESTDWSTLAPDPQSVGPNVRQVTYGNLQASTKHTYRVLAWYAENPGDPASEVSAWSNQHAVTTDAPPYDLSWIKAPEHTVEARLPAQFMAPHANMGPDSPYRFTHNSVPYRRVISVLGGRPPFKFTIEGIDSATITEHAPSWNPELITWAEVDLPPGVEGTYTVKVWDQDNTDQSKDPVIQTSVTVTKDNDRFVFINIGSADGGDGSYGNALNSWDDLMGGVGSQDTEMFAGKFAIFRAGTYPVIGNNTAQDGSYYHSKRARAYMAWPGEEVIWDCATVPQGALLCESRGDYLSLPSFGSDTEDFYLADIKAVNVDCLLQFAYTHERMVLANIHVDDIVYSGARSGVIYIRDVFNGFSGPYRDRALVNLTCDGATGVESNNSAFVRTSGANMAIDHVRIDNAGTLFRNAVQFTHFQHGLTTTRSVRAWDNTTLRAQGATVEGARNVADIQEPVAQYAYSLIATASPTNKQSIYTNKGTEEQDRGARYVDRNVVIGGCQDGGQHPNSYQHQNVTVNDDEDKTYANWVITDRRYVASGNFGGVLRDDGTLKTGDRYQRGWEVSP